MLSAKQSMWISAPYSSPHSSDRISPVIELFSINFIKNYNFSRWTRNKQRGLKLKFSPLFQLAPSPSGKLFYIFQLADKPSNNVSNFSLSLSFTWCFNEVRTIEWWTLNVKQMCRLKSHSFKATVTSGGVGCWLSEKSFNVALSFD